MRRTDRQQSADPTPRPRKSRAVLLIAVLVAVAGGIWALTYRAAAGPAWCQPRPRSVLLITLDTTRADHLGCYGGRTAATPHLDRLAAEGTRFATCRSCSALTLPSHASILTGVYPYVHGARRNGSTRVADGNVTLAETLRDAGYATRATIAAYVLNAVFGIDQGFDEYRDVIPPATGNVLKAERKGDEICDDALDLLAAVRDERFFLWVHFYDPHFPYLSNTVDDIFSPLAYADEVEFMDAQVGRLMNGLHSLGLARDTLVIVVGDHGEGLNEHEEWTHGYFLYDTTILVPLIFWCPDTIPAGQTVTPPVRTVDIAPTILALVAAAPWEHAQGVSLTGLMTGDPSSPPPPAYAESFEAQSQYGLSALRSWTTADWKYIHTSTPELYHLAADPGETRNLLESEPQRAAQALTDLRQLIADAPPTVRPDATAGLSTEGTRVLESLGYVGSGNPFEDEDVTELDRFDPVGDDPRICARFLKPAAWELPQLMRQQRYADAEHLIRQMLAAMPRSAYLQGHLAEAVGLQGRHDEAADAFEQALALAPEDTTTRRKFGEFLQQIDRPEAALAQFRAVLQQLPDDTGALQGAGLALAALGRFDEARRHLQVALELDERNVHTLRIMGLVAEQEGHLPESLQWFVKALALDPDYARCEQDRQRVLKKMGL